jgi:CRP-like cAMP-binding protein
LHAIVRGKVRISAGDPDGLEVFFNILAAGDTFGEIALLDGGPRTATATAMVASELLSIPRASFYATIEREPRLALELLRLCGERLRWTSGLAEDAALLDPPARLARRLLLLAAGHGEPAAHGLALRLSQEDLASFLGVSRQLVNQYLQEWKQRGWVDLARGAVVIRDTTALARLTGR